MTHAVADPYSEGGGMSGGETESDPSNWNEDTLKLYYDQRFADFEKRMDERAEAQNKAILKSETAAEKRFESVNEFRQQLADQSNTFMPREVADATFTALTARISALENQAAGMVGRLAGMIVGATLLISVVVFLSR